MLPINKKITPHNFTAMSNKKNEYIVVHYVGAVSTAKNNVDYYAREKLQASATYFVDENSIWQSVEDHDRAWHCGGGLQGPNGHTLHGICTNSNSIGIEMCVKKTATGAWYFEEATISNTIDLIRHLMQKYNIPIEKVVRHYDVTGKLCPAPYVDETAWANFKSKITNGQEDEEVKAQIETLTKTVQDLTKRVQALEEKNNEFIYAWVDENMPEWARPTITKLMDAGALKGDEEGKLNLKYDMLRTLVILDRTGAFGK